MRVYICHHAETAKNLNGNHGHGDERLTDTGREQALAIAALLSRHESIAVVSSPNERCRWTGQAVLGHLQTLGTLEVSAGLMGINLGPLDGLTDNAMAQVAPSFAREMKAWAAGERRQPPTIPGGETAHGFLQRVGSAADNITATHDTDAIALICPNSTVQALTFIARSGSSEVSEDTVVPYYYSAPGDIEVWDTGQAHIEVAR